MQDQIMRAMEQADSLIGLGAELKTFGVKYEFYVTEGPVPTHYRMAGGGVKYLVCRPEHADDDAIIVNGLALEVAKN